MRQMFTLVGFVLLTAVIGCAGSKPVPVVVTLDGKPVEGATVVLVPEDGKGSTTFTGYTSANGTTNLDSNPKAGVKAGNYKVLVTKVKSVSGTAVDPKSPDAKKLMMSMKGGAPKSELPEKYSNAKATPLTLTVPPPSSPAPIELTSK